MDSPSQAPPVVAVVVTCDPGPWFDEALQALAGQDYPNLSVLVIDAGSAEDPTRRVAAVLPGAYVRRLPENRGFAASANEVLDVVEGASHFLLCHDDVAPDPDAVRLLVEEAFRSNAGVVAPKLVAWEDRRVLLQVGMGADKSGAPAPLVDPGELDQEQHDGVRDVFVAPGGATLVRADLFASLGGYDPVMHLYGEDLDLSWRAQVAGARVLVAPAARVRHLEAMSSGRRPPGGGASTASPDSFSRRVRTLQLRHRLRAVLKDYGTWHLVRVLPQVALLAVAEVVFGLVTGHTSTARDTTAAWSWNLRRVGELRQARRAVRRSRRVGDAEVRRLQARGSARVNGFVRGQLAGQRVRRRTRGAVVRQLATEAGEGDQSLRLPLLVGAGVALVLLVGSRHLITGGIPAVHELAPFPGPWSALRSFLSGWRQTGLGGDDPAAPALALIGLGGLVAGGATGLLQTVTVLGALPLGVIGAFRLARPLGSRRARLAAVIVYAGIPLPYNALAEGRWSGLVAYGVAPWVLSRLLRTTALEPFGEGRAPAEALRRELLPLGVLLAVSVALAPSLVVMAVLAAAGIVAGSMVAGRVGAAGWALAAVAGALAVAAVLLFPWTLDFVLPGSQVSSVMGVGIPPARAHGLGALLRFETGDLGAAPIGWAFAAAASLPLLIGRGWRLAWAARSWGLALSCVGVAWAGGRGWLGVGVPAAEVLLAPAAAGLALAVALGMVAFEADLPRYRFGWRQAASTTALVVTLAGLLPVAAAAAGGRWGTPRQDISGLLSWMPEQRGRGEFRVLWMGDPEALPLRSWRLSEGVGYATSRNGPPDATVLWPGASPGAAELVAQAVWVARANGTTRLGHLLAPTAIRYVVVPLRAAPSGEGTPTHPPPPDLGAALDAQVDLKKLQGDEALLLYENAAWAPGRSRLPPGAAAASRRGGLAGVRVTELSGSAPVLGTRRSPNRFSGPLDEGDHVLVSEASSSRWQLRVAGVAAPRTEAFGWANGFVVPASGQATLRYRTSPLRYLLIAVEVCVWVLVGRALVARRRREAPTAGGRAGR